MLTGEAAEPPTGAARMTSYHAELAWVDGRPQADVAIGVEGDRFAFVTPGAPPPAGATRLPGLSLPGLADTHSHAFHRALRGRTHQGLGTFWAWRRRMYQVAQRLQPDTYLALATAIYAELALAGWVRNLPDGTVEVYAQGAVEAVAALRGWLRTGPPGAKVAQVQCREAAATEGLTGFEVRR